MNTGVMASSYSHNSGIKRQSNDVFSQLGGRQVGILALAAVRISTQKLHQTTGRRHCLAEIFHPGGGLTAPPVQQILIDSSGTSPKFSRCMASFIQAACQLLAIAIKLFFFLHLLKLKNMLKIKKANMQYFTTSRMHTIFGIFWTYLEFLNQHNPFYFFFLFLN